MKSKGTEKENKKSKINKKKQNKRAKATWRY
jgi:hypothetical protein